MEYDKRLSIIILTADKRRGIRILESVARLEMYNMNFIIKLARDQGKLYTHDAVYRIVTTEKPEKWQGNSADQVIIDMRGDNYKIAQYILARSCVPEACQIIDDRDIL